MLHSFKKNKRIIKLVLEFSQDCYGCQTCLEGAASMLSLKYHLGVHYSCSSLWVFPNTDSLVGKDKHSNLPKRSHFHISQTQARKQQHRRQRHLRDICEDEWLPEQKRPQPSWWAMGKARSECAHAFQKDTTVTSNAWISNAVEAIILLCSSISKATHFQRSSL